MSDDANQLAVTVRKGQIDVQTRTVALSATIDDPAGDSASNVQQMLRRLAYNEMLGAAEQAETLLRITIAGELATHCGRLKETQDTIIKALQKLLESNRQESIAIKGERVGGDSSAEAKEPLTDAMTAAPMAEMPGELEERVGQLMQEEEDLFDEIKNLAGSGEDSHSAEAELKRMAGRQADLRKRAEAAEINFQVLNYHQTDLNRIVELMKAVEADLRTGRYQSALRQRQVLLDSLEDIKRYLGGELEVRRERWSNLPTEIGEQLLGSMLDESPRGWAEWNRKYFERLSRDATPAAAGEPGTRESR
jgi:hypothetical protein